jgi:hypothetical protein
VRYRGELDGRFFNANAKPLFFNLLRSSLGVKATLNADVTAFVQLQDSRNLGEVQDGAWRGSLDGSADNFDMRQAWLEWRNFLAPGLTMKLGRQIFATNNERLIGALDWHNVGRSYDGAQFTFAPLAVSPAERWQARAFAFVLGNDELLMTSAARQNPQALIGADLSLPWQQAFNVYIYHDRAERKIRPVQFSALGDSTSLQRFTAGLYLKNIVENTEYEFEGAYQFGSRQDIAGAGGANTLGTAQIGAFLLTGYVGKRFQNEATGEQGSIGLGADFYSGDDPTTNATSEGFNHLFTTIHKFYGFMDFFPFAVLPSAGLRSAPDISRYGLFDGYLRVTYSPSAKTDLYVCGHYFTAPIALPVPPANVSGAGGLFSESNNIGIEFDATVTHKIFPFLSAQFGASVFFPTNAMREGNVRRGLGRDAAYWGYVMLTATF